MDIDIKEIIIIGGGPGGYVAAIRGAQLGAKVTLVEEQVLGGTCLNWGCIPTKALYKNAELLNTLKKIDDFGITVKDYSIDLSKFQDRKKTIVKGLVQGINQLLKANGVEIKEGKAAFINKNTIKITNSKGDVETLQAKNIIIATGSKVTKPPIPGSNLKGVITSDELLEMAEIPQRLVIVGGGVIGIEFASILNSFGSKVTVIEFMPSILPLADGELAKRLTLSLKKRGIDIHTETRVLEIERSNDSLVVKTEGKKNHGTYEADLVLMATGRAINVDGLNLEAVGVKFDSQGIEVNEHYETNISGIYAIGDVIGGYMLAHVASEEGKVAVENMLGQSSHLSYDAVPSCIFTFPELAGVGMTEEEVKEKNLEYFASKFQFGANGKALTMGEGEGLVKVIAEKETKQILGVHILGPHASDLIHEPTLALSQKLKAEAIIKTIHAHPTLSEAILEAVAGIHDEAIHVAPKRKTLPRELT